MKHKFHILFPLNTLVECEYKITIRKFFHFLYYATGLQALMVQVDKEIERDRVN